MSIGWEVHRSVQTWCARCHVWINTEDADDYVSCMGCGMVLCGGCYSRAEIRDGHDCEIVS